MKAHEIIDRLATLDEQTHTEEPQVDPGILPDRPAAEPEPPSAPRRSTNPYELPPDFQPGQMPYPKSEDESGAIGEWLEATQQPIQDWDWDGQELRMLMDDGSTEVYNRGQLEEIGVFGGEMAFAESEENDDGGDDSSDYAGVEGPDMETVQAAIDAEQHSQGDATGTLDMILGRTPCSAPVEAEPMSDAGEMIPVEGEKAEELVQAVSDVVQAILGIVSDEGGKASDSSSNKPSDKDKSDKNKSDKDKGEKEKETDKKEDKKDAKKDDDDNDE